MSQVTILDDVLNFTELRAATASDSSPEISAPFRQQTPSETRYDSNEAHQGKILNEDEQRMAYELTSILISGRLPK